MAKKNLSHRRKRQRFNRLFFLNRRFLKNLFKKLPNKKHAQFPTPKKQNEFQQHEFRHIQQRQFNQQKRWNVSNKQSKLERFHNNKNRRRISKRKQLEFRLFQRFNKQ